MTPQVARPCWIYDRRRSLIRLALLLLPGLLPPFLSSQTGTTGAISGHVEDVQGHLIETAEISIYASNQVPRILRWSSVTGEFVIPALPPTEYAVDLRAPGAQLVHLRHILVEIGGTTRVHITVFPTSISAVTVTAKQDDDLEEPPVAASTVISPKELQHLPANGRRWQDFALLTPEVNSGTSSEQTGLLSFRGIAPTQNSSRIDGADDDQSFNASPHGSGTDGGPETEDESESEGKSSSGRTFSSGSGGGRRPGVEFTFAQEAVHEFRVVGQSYSALYGHAAGGVITTVSRGGTDALHGSAFYLVRESAWAATNPFSIATHYTAQGVTTALVKPDDQRQQFGGSMGGPIAPARYPHRFFYFYAVEAQRRSFPAISSPENPAFYALTDMQRALLGTRGVSMQQVDTALRYLDSLTGVVPRRADQTVNFLKLDGYITARNQLSIQYNRSRFSSPSGVRSAPVVNRAVRSFGSQNINIDSVISRWTYAHHSNFSNELRLQYNRDHHFEEAQTPLRQEPAIASGSLAPEIAIGPQGLYFGTPASLGKRAAPDEHRFEITQVTTLVHNRHLVQAGLTYSYVRDATDSLANSDGTFHYDSAATNGRAGGLVDWITDYTFNVNTIPNGACPSIHAAIHDFCFRSFSQSFGQQTASFSTQEFAGFLQERWRASETLSLTAGVRYEYELLPLPQTPNMAVDAAFSAKGATSIFPEDRNNLGPRVAAAWQPRGEGRGTVRVAYGVYFGRLPAATIRTALVDTATPRSASRIRILPTTITGCPQVENQGFGYPCTYTATPPNGVAATTSVAVFDRHFRMPMSQQGSLSLERDVHHLVTVSATYLLNLNRQLPNSVDVNIAPATTTRTFQLQGGTKTVGVRDGDTFIIPVYTRRVSSNFGPVTAITSNANGTYNALVIEARHRSRDGFELRASWTWSKSIDFGQNTGSVPHTNGQFDPFNVRYDKSLSSSNTPHKFVVSAVWHPQPIRALHIWKRLSSGWLLAPVLTESAGRPYSYNIFGGTRLTGGHESVNGSGGDVYLSTIGRNTLRLPENFNTSLRVVRELRFSESLHLDFIAEAFNLTNHVNYTSVTERAFLVGTASNGITPLIYQNPAAVVAEGLNSLPFGALTSSSSESSRERQLQFGIRLEF